MYYNTIIKGLPLGNISSSLTLNGSYLGTYYLVDEFHSDQGSDFMSKVQKQVLALFGIRRTHTISYSPWSSGAEPSVKKASEVER